MKPAVNQPARRPAQQAPRPDQRNDGDRAANHRRMPQHADARRQAAIHAAELVLDLFRARTELLALHGAARQQIAVMGVELIERR